MAFVSSVVNTDMAGKCKRQEARGKRENISGVLLSTKKISYRFRSQISTLSLEIRDAL